MKRTIRILLTAAVLSTLLMIQAFAMPGQYGTCSDSGSASQTTAAASQTGDLSCFNAYQPRSLSAAETLRKGVDVSEFQGNIDWKKAAESGIEFAIIRVGGRYAGAGAIYSDDLFEQNFDGARAAGIQVGVYFYSQAITEAEGREEARFILQQLDGRIPDLPVVIDYEYYSNSSGLAGRLYNARLTKAQATAVCNAFCDEVECSGLVPMVYANLSMLTDSMNASQLTSRVWLANFTTRTDYTGSYAFWQCSCTGNVPGIPYQADLDFWFDDGSLSGEAQTEPEGGKEAGTGGEEPPESSAGTGGEEAPESSAGSGSEETPESSAGSGSEETPEGSAGTGSNGTPDSSAGTGHKDSADHGTNAALPFNDVDESDWGFDSIRYCYTHGIVNGCTASAFEPESNTTRGQIAAMLYRAAGQPEVTGTATFTDLTQDYYRNAILWAQQQNIVKGYSSQTFGPEDQVTRQDLVVMLYRFAGAPAVSGSLSRYQDRGLISDYAKDAVRWAVQNGILNGTSETTISPKDYATRQEISAMLARYMQKFMITD